MDTATTAFTLPWCGGIIAGFWPGMRASPRPQDKWTPADTHFAGESRLLTSPRLMRSDMALQAVWYFECPSGMVNDVMQ